MKPWSHVHLPIMPESFRSREAEEEIQILGTKGNPPHLWFSHVVDDGIREGSLLSCYALSVYYHHQHQHPIQSSVS